MWQMPIIVSAFTAVQKVAATHGDAILNTNDERAVWAKRSLARWAHGLSAVEPGHVEHKERHPRDSSLSSEEVEIYSPTSNYLLTRKLPVPVSSTYARKQLEMEIESLDVEPDDSGDEDQVVTAATTHTQVASQITESLITPPTTCSEILMSVANAEISDTTPTIISMPIIDLEAGILQSQAEGEKSTLAEPEQQIILHKAPAEKTMSEAAHVRLEKNSSHVPTTGVVESPKRRLFHSSLQNVLSSMSTEKPTTPEPENGTAVTETFFDLLKVYDVDATLAEKLTRPLSACLSPLHDASLLSSEVNQTLEEEPALELYASPQASLEEESERSSNSSPKQVRKKRINRDDREMKTNPDKEQLLKRPKADISSETNKSVTNNKVEGFKIPFKPSQSQNRPRGGGEDGIVDTASVTAPRRGRDDDRRHGHRRSRPSYHPRRSPDRSHTMIHSYQRDELTLEQLRWLQRMNREWHR